MSSLLSRRMCSATWYMGVIPLPPANMPAAAAAAVAAATTTAAAAEAQQGINRRTALRCHDDKQGPCGRAASKHAKYNL